MNVAAVLSAVTSHLASDQGWVTVETVSIQLNTSLTPSGRFPVYSDLSWLATGNRIGYDAVVCVQKYEPWIVEAYNTSTGSSFALQIAGKGNVNIAPSPSGSIQGARIEGARYLNATGKDFVFSMVHNASIERFSDVNLYQGRKPGGIYYTPTPTVGPTMPPRPTSLLTRSIPQIVSFSEGTGLDGYVELSPDRVAAFRARAGAVNVLPYLVGSGPVVAQLYRDETLAYTTFKPWQLIAVPVVVLILGTVGELFVPALPLGIPRREFGIYSWLALLRSQARGLSRVICTSADRASIFRSCNLRGLMTSVSS